VGSPFAALAGALGTGGRQAWAGGAGRRTRAGDDGRRRELEARCRRGICGDSLGGMRADGTDVRSVGGGRRGGRGGGWRRALGALTGAARGWGGGELRGGCMAIRGCDGTRAG